MNQVTDQSHAVAGGDNVGGSKTVLNLPPREKLAAFKTLKKRLAADMAANLRVMETIDKLKKYETQITYDGVIGLHDKLSKANREDELMYALTQKERFSMFLSEWSFFETAQQLIALALATIEYEYTLHIIPHVSTLTRQQVDELIHTRVVI